MADLPHNAGMLEPLRTWAAPYGGDAFLYITLLAVVSFIALLAMRHKLSTFTLRRFIRLGALVALPLTFVSMEMGENNWPIAVVAMVWAVLVAITSHHTASQRNETKK